MSHCSPIKDIDECKLELYNCDSIRVCVNTEGGYECDCPKGYYDRDDGTDCLGMYAEYSSYNKLNVMNTIIIIYLFYS